MITSNSKVQKKAKEFFQLCSFFSILNKTPEEIYAGEPPDFVIKLQRRKIGIELTDYHSSVKNKNGKPLRSIEEDWEKLKIIIMDKVIQHSELQKTYGQLNFKEIELPHKSKWQDFTDELIKLSLEMVKCGYGEIQPDKSRYPLLNQYLSSLFLEKTRFHITWDWNKTGGCIGVRETEIINSVKRKVKKTTEYRENTNVEELWLIIVSNFRLSQVMPRTLLDYLNTFKQLESYLKTSGYDKIYIYQYPFECIYEWPGWTEICCE